MAHLDVHRNLNRRTAQRIPYLIDLQDDLLREAATRVVAPLALAAGFRRTFERLEPVLQIEGVEVVMSTLEIVSIPQRDLGPIVASAGGGREQIVAALDLLFTGV